MYNLQYRNMQALVMEECKLALESIRDEDVQAFIELILIADKVFFVGVGRVLLSLESIAKRYAHLGIQTVVVGQITEPAITNKDVLVVGSGSGETLFPVGIAKKAKKIGAKVVHVGSNPTSSLSETTDLFIRIPVESRANREDEIRSAQPMTSLFEQVLLLFGDITAMILIQEKKLKLEELWQYHANLE